MKRWIMDLLAILFGAFLLAIGFNFLLIPHQLLSGGLSGVAMLIGYFTDWNIGLLMLLLNVPVIIWGLIAIGKRFVILSLVSVAVTTWLMQIIPVKAVAEEPILAAVFGGVLVGAAAGISLRVGGSTGGFDIIGSIITRNRDFPLGSFLFILNGFVILFLGYYKDNWDLALFSMLSIYVGSKLVDSIHIRHVKITAFIVTREKDKLLKHLLQSRGVTLIKTEGAYSNQEQDMLMMVTTRYELAELKKVIKESDPKAFVNIVETAAILGEFRRKH
ncbi:YitT family protein [Gorillibacterium massiliense]|uniref:YitT family protein n=1 Tax=Gorillibacterium massiliense TaxID=1280390 RepID=UPI0004B3B180|nr:YitT family protein [Gorillibacterium massiliense]